MDCINELRDSLNMHLGWNKYEAITREKRIKKWNRQMTEIFLSCTEYRPINLQKYVLILTMN